MPLLNNKLYLVKKTKKNIEKNGDKISDKSEDEYLLLKSTNEICENEDEYKRKQYLYNKKIWTCRFTNTPSLTFKEAEKSETLNLKYLKNFFKKCFEKATLQYVHNSKDSLETLVHKAWTFIHQEYCEYEPVKLKITDPKQMTVNATIVKVDQNKTENQENEDLTKKSADSPPEKKKAVPEKKRQFYVVKVPGVEKLVNNIPTDNIERVLRPPSKDNIKMCIRAHAVRFCGKANNSWVVQEELVKKYKLADKNTIVDFKQHNDALKESSRNAEIFMFNKVNEESKKGPVLKEENSLSQGSELKTKIYKQTTLNVMKSSPSNHSMKKGKISTSPKFSQFPAIATKLIKQYRDPKHNESVIKNLIFTCASTLSYTTIAKLPSDIMMLVKVRKDRLEERKKLDSMTSEQREAYFILKRAEQRKKRQAENVKTEDSELANSVTLPKPFPFTDANLSIGDGSHMLSYAQWSRVLSVTEFMRCYRKLLDPNCGDTSSDKSVQLTVNELCQSLLPTTDAEKFVFSSTVCMLLKPILQDEKIGESKQLGITLSDIPVTPCTTTELLRLALPLSISSSNDDDKKSVNDNDLDDNNAISETNSEGNKTVDAICQKLRAQELCDLSIDEKIETLELLKDRVMELESMSNFLEEHQREVVEAYKRRSNDSREINERMKEVKSQKQELLQKVENSQSTEAAEAPKDQTEESENLTYSSKRKQSLELKLRETEEKERRIELERQILRLEKEEASLRRQLEAANRAHSKAVQDAKQLMRVQPLGYDRHHSRYWVFPSAGEGLFVELQQGLEESTWGFFKNPDEVEVLKDALNVKGVRESVLKHELDSLITKMREQAAVSKDDDDSEPKGYFMRERQRQQEAGWSAVTNDEFLWRGFKSDLRDLESSIRLASLGVLSPEIAEIWEATLASSQSIENMKMTMLHVVNGVYDRFLNIDKADLLLQIKDAESVSRLCFLTSLFDAGMKWERAATGPESQKCRVCKRGHDESRMLLCDGCNRAFHTFCLRPPLKRIPTGEWLCQACNKGSQRKMRSKEIAINAGQDEEQIKEEAVNGEVCCVCGENDALPMDDDEDNVPEKLTYCSSCNQYYHSACHDPPLRNARRQTNWKCTTCRQSNQQVEASQDSDSPEIPATVSRKKSKVSAKPTRKPSKLISRRLSQRVSVKRKFHEEEVVEEESSEESVMEDESDQEPENLQSISRTRSNRKKSLVDDSCKIIEPSRKRSRRYETKALSPSTSSDDYIESTIEKLLNRLYNHRCSNDFIDPVDESNVPDYYEIIKNPICISTMLQHNQDGQYKSKSGLKLFLQHITQLFSNAETYNHSSSTIAKRAAKLEAFFESLYNKYELPIMYSRERANESQSADEEEEED